MVSRLLGKLTEAERDELDHSWELFARPEQIEPEGDWWSTWLFLAGRGAGKTRAGAEWIREQVKQGFKILGAIAPTTNDVRNVMVEGPAGIIQTGWAGDEDVNGKHVGLPEYQPSKRRVVWQNGAICFLYSAEEPNRLRGPQHEKLWADELAAWQYAQDTWDMAQFGLRLGTDPKALVTTTPRPIPIVKALIADPATVVTRATTSSNKANLAASFLAKIYRQHEGTRLGRQELGGELLEDIPGALWTRVMIEKNRVRKEDVPELLRIVVAVDPSGASGEEGETNNAIGIVAAGRGADGKGYILADRTCIESPRIWGSRSVLLYRDTGFGPADLIVAEDNFGGAMVEHVIRSVDNVVSYKAVKASRGKVVRMEPVSSLGEQNRIKWVGGFAALEDECCAFTPEGYMGDGSPNRADAMVWAVHELMLGESSYDLDSLAS